MLRPFGAHEVKSKWNALLSSFQPDIVHLHNIHSQLSPIIAKEAYNKNIPVFWTLHDYKLLCPASAFLDSNGSVCEDCLSSSISVYKKNCIKRSKLASFIGYLEAKKWNSTILSRYTTTFISPSQFLRNQMIKGGYDPNIISQIYNFSNNEKFENKVIETREKNIVYVGRISIEKGVETLCKAFCKIDNAKLLIIGDGPLKNKLEKTYSSTSIQFLGFQNWNKIKEILQKASFLVIPSEWYENNPLTILEAFSLGTPVLGANIGGIPELISTNKNGMIFKSRDITDLEQKIKMMINFNNWDYYRIQREANLKFNENIYYQKLIELYNNSLQ